MIRMTSSMITLPMTNSKLSRFSLTCGRCPTDRRSTRDLARLPCQPHSTLLQRNRRSLTKRPRKRSMPRRLTGTRRCLPHCGQAEVALLPRPVFEGCESRLVIEAADCVSLEKSDSVRHGVFPCVSNKSYLKTCSPGFSASHATPILRCHKSADVRGSRSGRSCRRCSRRRRGRGLDQRGRGVPAASSAVRR
jgi:hypothetical protein